MAADTTTHRVGFGLVALLTLASAAGLAYFSVIGLADPGKLVEGGGTDGAKVFAGYMAVRGIVLIAALVGLLAMRAWRPLAWFLAFDAAVQFGDTVLGIENGKVAETIGPAVFTVLLAVAAIWLWRRAPAQK